MPIWVYRALAILLCGFVAWAVILLGKRVKVKRSRTDPVRREETLAGIDRRLRLALFLCAVCIVLFFFLPAFDLSESADTSGGSI